jgi:hypothetical protein
MMLKILMLAGLLLVSVTSNGPAAAQAQAPMGQRQPSAADVPANDSVRGDPGLAGGPRRAGPTPKKRARSHRVRRVQSNIDVIMKTPNICSNCNQ